MSRGACVCAAEQIAREDGHEVEHAINCPAHPRSHLIDPRFREGLEAVGGVALVGPRDLEPAWTPEEQERWKFEQEAPK